MKIKHCNPCAVTKAFQAKTSKLEINALMEFQIKYVNRIRSQKTNDWRISTILMVSFIKRGKILTSNS